MSIVCLSFKDEAQLALFNDITRTDKYNKVFGKSTFQQVHHYREYCKYMIKDIEKTTKTLDMYALIENKLCIPTVEWHSEENQQDEQ